MEIAANLLLKASSSSKARALYPDGYRRSYRDLPLRAPYGLPFLPLSGGKVGAASDQPPNLNPSSLISQR